MITGRTKLIVHLGFPTESFKAPMIYNPWFEMKGIDVVVVPVGVEPPNYPEAAENAVPDDQRARCPGHHAAQGDDDEAGGRNDHHGENCRRLQRDPAPSRRDAARGHVRRRRLHPRGGTQGQADRRSTCPGGGCGGVGSAIAASMAAAGASAIGLFDPATTAAEALGERLRQHYPELDVRPDRKIRSATTSSSMRRRSA